MADRGVTRRDAAPAGNAGGGGSSAGPMTLRVRMRGPEAGGAKEGTPELYLSDPDGIVVQLQDVSYCGGAGVLGNVCSAPEPSPKKGLLAVRDLSHFTIFSDAQRSNKFYQDLFGFSIRSYQGPTAPTLAVGPTVQFLMFTGGGAPARGSAPPRPASINHVCMNMDGFDPDKILKTLETYGIKPRGNAPGPAAQLPEMEAAILSPDLKFLPKGQTGELALHGPQIALGYFNDEAKTAARFPMLDHPQLGKTRWYLTGDQSLEES
jgi:acyl-CoA synthetase (AMP-forming)/AMP-acid ligase II